jgi:hypothetical protein
VGSNPTLSAMTPLPLGFDFPDPADRSH